MPADIVGPGHPGGGLPLVTVTPPVVGTPCCVAFPSALGAALLVLSAAPGSVPPVALGAPGLCAAGFLYPSLTQAFITPLAGLPVAWACFVPPVESANQGFCVQAFALDTGTCLRATDGLVLTVQR